MDSNALLDRATAAAERGDLRPAADAYRQFLDAVLPPPPAAVPPALQQVCGRWRST